MYKRKRLPQRLIALKNADKKFHEKWYKGRDLINFPHPYRGVFLGPPNSGKSTIVQNIVVHADPPFMKIIVVHCDPQFSEEYNKLEVELTDEIPSPKEFDGIYKTLVILDDLEFKSLSKEQKKNLDRLFGYVSTHKNVSCMLCSQDPFQVPTIVRRCSNLWVLWKMDDIDTMARVARRTGLLRDDFMYIFNKVMDTDNNPHQSLWIDKTSRSPAKLRIDGYDIINKEVK